MKNVFRTTRALLMAAVFVAWSGDLMAQTTYYRSIGTEPDYGTNEVGYGLGTQVSVTNGSVIVNGVGSPKWQTANRGRGDRINIDGVDYTILRVSAEDQLLLASAYAGTDGTYDYTIYRKFATIGGWADCVSNTTLTLPECHDVTSSDLTATGDNRSEVGVVYNESRRDVPGDSHRGTGSLALVAVVRTGDESLPL